MAMQFLGPAVHCDSGRWCVGTVFFEDVPGVDPSVTYDLTTALEKKIRRLYPDVELHQAKKVKMSFRDFNPRRPIIKFGCVFFNTPL
jgi:hypothetical protein